MVAFSVVTFRFLLSLLEQATLLTKSSFSRSRLRLDRNLPLLCWQETTEMACFNYVILFHIIKWSNNFLAWARNSKIPSYSRMSCKWNQTRQPYNIRVILVWQITCHLNDMLFVIQITCHSNNLNRLFLNNLFKNNLFLNNLFNNRIVLNNLFNNRIMTTSFFN